MIKLMQLMQNQYRQSQVHILYGSNVVAVWVSTGERLDLNSDSKY